MIEAVKSTVANSALHRGSMDQSSTLNSFAANPDKIQQVSQAPYVSPTVRVDVNTKIAILEFRESITGEVLAQIPSEQAIRTYKLREAKDEAQLLAKLTQKTGAQKGTTPQVHTAAPAQEITPAPQATTPAPSTSDTDVSLSAELTAITTQIEVSA